MGCVPGLSPAAVSCRVGKGLRRAGGRSINGFAVFWIERPK